MHRNIKDAKARSSQGFLSVSRVLHRMVIGPALFTIFIADLESYREQLLIRCTDAAQHWGSDT